MTSPSRYELQQNTQMNGGWVSADLPLADSEQRQKLSLNSDCESLSYCSLAHEFSRVIHQYKSMAISLNTGAGNYPILKNGFSQTNNNFSEMKDDMNFKPALIHFYTIQLYSDAFSVKYDSSLFSYSKRKIAKVFRNTPNIRVKT